MMSLIPKGWPDLEQRNLEGLKQATLQFPLLLVCVVLSVCLQKAYLED